MTWQAQLQAAWEKLKAQNHLVQCHCGQCELELFPKEQMVVILFAEDHCPIVHKSHAFWLTQHSGDVTIVPYNKENNNAE